MATNKERKRKVFNFAEIFRSDEKWRHFFFFFEKKEIFFKIETRFSNSGKTTEAAELTKNRKTEAASNLIGPAAAKNILRKTKHRNEPNFFRARALKIELSQSLSF